MKFAREKYSDELVDEMWPLWKKHYDEVAAFKDILLDPDLKLYEGCAERNSLRIFTARNEDQLMGYQVFLVLQNSHYKSMTQAVQDILYIDPSMRKGMTGYRFIKWCDTQLASEEVQFVFQHVKAAHDFTGILERLGYKLHEKIMARRLN